jgi:protein-tyrosine phosphatase
VPDPYYGGAEGFDHVIDLVELAADAFLQVIRQDCLEPDPQR